MAISSRQRRAVRLMFLMTDSEIAEELGVRRSTVSSWRKNPEFSTALREESRLVRSAVSTLLSGVILAAARGLKEALEKGADVKLMLDTLKAASAFDPAEEEPAETLEDVLKRIAENHTPDNLSIG